MGRLEALNIRRLYGSTVAACAQLDIVRLGQRTTERVTETDVHRS